MKNFVVFVFVILFSAGVFGQDNSLLQTRYNSAQSLERAGLYEKALAVYLDLVNIQPGNFIYADALNRMYVQLKQYDNSAAFLKKRIEQYKQDINLYGLLGVTYYLMDSTQHAYEIWESALDLNPSQPVNHKLIAQYVIECRDFDKALDILIRGKQISSDPRLFSYDLANIYSLTMEFSRATEEYCEILNTTPEQINIVKNRINAYLNRHNASDPTIAVISRFAEEKDTPVFWDLLSYVYMQTGDYDKSFDAVQKFDEKSFNNGAQLFSFAQLTGRDGQYDISTRTYDLFFEKYPNSPLIHQAKISYINGLEEILDKKNNSSDNEWKPYTKIDTSGAYEYLPVIDSYNRLANEANQLEIRALAAMRVGSIYLERLNLLDRAENIFNQIIEKFPLTKSVIGCYQKLGRIYLMKEDKARSVYYYKKSLSMPNNETELQNLSRYKLAQIYFYESKYDSALTELSGIMNDLSDDNANNALELSLIINTFRGDSLNLSLFAGAEYLAGLGRFEEAVLIYKELSENDNLFILNNLSKFRVAQMLIALDNYNDAIPVLEEISNEEKNPLYSDKALFLLGNIYQFGLKDSTKANAVYKKFLEKFPNSLYFDRVRELINVTNTEDNKPI